jgi:hypothetical protein
MADFPALFHCSLLVISIPIRTSSANELKTSSIRDEILARDLTDGHISPTTHEETSPRVLQTQSLARTLLLQGLTLEDAVMAFTSTKAGVAESILALSITLKGQIQSISYFPDGQRMTSRSSDKTTGQWDVMAGREWKSAECLRGGGMGSSGVKGWLMSRHCWWECRLWGVKSL